MVLVFVLRCTDHHKNLMPEAFGARFGWKNQPSKVRLPSDAGE